MFSSQAQWHPSRSTGWSKPWQCGQTMVRCAGQLAVTPVATGSQIHPPPSEHTSPMVGGPQQVPGGHVAESTLPSGHVHVPPTHSG